jgi:predicted ABC-type ATPase
MSDKIKRLRIFAGPNGSGKTTLFRDFSQKYSTGFFVNADIVEKELSEKGFINLSELEIESSEKRFLSYSKKSSLKAKAEKEGFKIDIQFRNNVLVNLSKETNSYEAAFVTSFLRQEFIKAGKNFSFETVMSHKSKIKEIKEAVAAGYRIYLYYICTDSVIINQERVKTRVQKGGHTVSENKIQERYHNSLELLSEAIKLSYRSYFFDNSGKEYRLVAEFDKGETSKIYKGYYPYWFNKYVIQKMDI